jgi:hypothetical protein
MAARSTFDKEERRSVRRALIAAEQLTERFYCIPGREWARIPYELTTLAEDPAPPVEAFAELLRLVPDPTAPKPPLVPSLYRIRLRDDTILEMVGRGGAGVELFPLLLYVLTHELVHVVRFAGGHAEFDAEGEVRRAEEARVHAITRKVLRPALEPELRRVVELYGGFEAGGGVSPK